MIWRCGDSDHAAICDANDDNLVLCLLTVPGFHILLGPSLSGRGKEREPVQTPDKITWQCPSHFTVPCEDKKLKKKQKKEREDSLRWVAVGANRQTHVVFLLSQLRKGASYP